VGVPVGLGAYLGWVHRDWSARSRFAGLLAAVAGAFAGTWLGLHAADGVLALLTAIAGAIAGANLLLILLDISRAGSRGHQAMSAEAQPPSVVLPGGAGRP
jgi:hypothetical protein